MRYKDWYTTYPGGGYLSDPEQIKNNANLIAVRLARQGYCLESICAVLGNMQHESTLNPYCFEGGSAPEYLDPPEEAWDWEHGWGLVQWTPGKYAYRWIWYRGAVYDGDWQLERLKYEHDNGMEWGGIYPYTWDEFMVNEPGLTVEELTAVFLYNYLRPASYASLPMRQQNALNWYNTPGLLLDRDQLRFALIAKKPYNKKTRRF